MTSFVAEPLFVLFTIMAIGWWIGQRPVRGISLGSAGVLFVALVFGHFGLRVPREIMDVGLLLFVYAVGLQAGPRFLRTFRRQGIQFVVVGSAAVLAGAAATIAVALVLHLPADLAAGLFTGALTNTPALAAATDALERIAPGQSRDVVAGYGIAYPYAMLSIVVLVQVLPFLLRRDLQAEEQRWRAAQRREYPELSVRTFVLRNPNCFGKRVSEIDCKLLRTANISRVRRGDQVFAATADIPLQEGDVVMIVGAEDELSTMSYLLGEETHVRMDINTTVASMDVEVTQGALTGKTLAQLRVWERYGVVVTRLRRAGLEIAPTGNVALELGDSIRIVGERIAVNAFAKLVHGDGREAEETHMVPFLLGMALGIALGSITFHLGEGLDLRLGAAGGVFVVSLVFGHVGRIGSLPIYVPAAAKNVLRELGLPLFLAGAGTNAGARIVPIIQERGASLLFAGMVITTVSALAALLVGLLLYRMNTLSLLGALCASMTNPPALAAASAHTSTGVPALAYASVYPVALIFKIILAQILVEILHLL